MSRTVLTETRSQQALQSYLDALLQDAAIELAVDSVSQDEFQAAVLEEQLRDTRVVVPQAEPVQPAVVESATVVPMPMPVPVRAEPVVELEVAPEPAGPRAPLEQGQPEWGEAPFECLLFDVAGLTLAVPLVSLGSIYSLAGEELTPLFGQPDWFLGILPCQAGNLKVLDTARWVMGDRYRDDFREGLQYVIS